MVTVVRFRFRPRWTPSAIALAVGFVCVASPALAARIARMDSMPVSTPHNAAAGVDLAAITRAVIAATELNEWRPTLEKPGVVRAEKVTHEGKHRATVRITYDTERYIVEYVTSHNLGYTARHCGSRAYGNSRMPKSETCFGPAIHPNYNVWLGTLVASIYDHIALLVAGHPGPTVRYALPGSAERIEVPHQPQPLLIADEIRKLKELADDGILSQAEFEARKQLLLAR